MAERPQLIPIGEDIVLLRFDMARRDDHIDQVQTLAQTLKAMAIPFEEIVPSYDSVAVKFDPLSETPETIIAHLKNHVYEDRISPGQKGQIYDIAVRYGGAYGPDLGDVSKHTGFSEAEIITRHTARTYPFCFYGFTPGFAYLGQTDADIHTPRRETPRTRVAKGSIGLAGWQTGWYGQDGPGGWQIIGRAQIPDNLCLEPGDQIRFVSV